MDDLLPKPSLGSQTEEKPLQCSHCGISKKIIQMDHSQNRRLESRFKNNLWYKGGKRGG